MTMASRANDIPSLDTEPENLCVKQECLPSREEPFSVVVTGITGSGKTTLIERITGVERSQANYGGIDRVDTTEVTPITCTLQENVAATLWDTPGLLGGPEMRRKGLSQMKEKCPQPDVVIFCIKCVDSRFVAGNENPNVRAIKILTKHFGKSFWKDAIIALTFANGIEQHHPMWQGLNSDEKRDSFEKEMKDWQKCVRNCLSSVSIPKKIIDSITIIPVGHSTCPTLVNGDDWLPELKSLCVNRLLNRASSSEGGSIIFGNGKLSEKQRGALIGGLIGGSVGLLIFPVFFVTVPIGVVVGVIVGTKVFKAQAVYPPD